MTNIVENKKIIDTYKEIYNNVVSVNKKITSRNLKSILKTSLVFMSVLATGALAVFFTFTSGFPYLVGAGSFLGLIPAAYFVNKKFSNYQFKCLDKFENKMINSYIMGIKKYDVDIQKAFGYEEKIINFGNDMKFIFPNFRLQKGLLPNTFNRVSLPSTEEITKNYQDIIDSKSWFSSLWSA